MSATSQKLSNELKQRVIAVAERRAGFVSEALAAREQMSRTGKGYDAGAVHAFLKARIAGRKPAKPKARPWQSRAIRNAPLPISKG